MKRPELATLPAPMARVSRRDELEFLPAALEIIETPASPAGRATGGLIILFFLLASAWAVIGRVEIVATGPGTIVPSGRTKVIQPLEIGIVRAINVHDGQHVKAGEVLVELDPTVSAAECDRLKSELVMARLEIARLNAILSEAPDPAEKLIAPPDATPAQIGLARQLVVSQVAGYRAKLAELDRQQAQYRANRAAVAATVDKLSAVLPVLRQRLEMRKSLYDRRLASKLNYLGDQEPVVESEHELVVQNDRLAEADATLLAIAEQRRQAEAEFRGSHLAELVAEEQKAAALGQELVKAERGLQLQTLTAPVDGVVQQLAIHTLGGVVTPAEALIKVVPADSPLEIEATLSNQDIGFVHAGQKAAIKIDTFDFTRYGRRHGEVLSVSLDAVGAEPTASEASSAQGGSMAAAQPRPMGGELSYTARISLDRTTMQTENGPVDLRPGMAVTVEIDTGTRRIIDYLLSPLRRYTQESLRER